MLKDNTQWPADKHAVVPAPAMRARAKPAGQADLTLKQKVNYQIKLCTQTCTVIWSSSAPAARVYAQGVTIHQLEDAKQVCHHLLHVAVLQAVMQHTKQLLVALFRSMSRCFKQSHQ